ncbi:unnamed protein product [Oppiella nova]|uniref:Chitin-binding type-2 domain-containing protein n=1 Tax=Oppiella nova TaxID=334625 RepID=A0A7R9LTG9_9ACAR|nr:unnamed protein product [Oppiella nova]CAG2166819.1 unnamed protein product [Oppiella nova]
MSKLFIIVGLLVAVCQGDESNGATTRGVDYWCSRDGFMPHPTDPHKFFQCEWVPGTGWYLHMEQCPQQTTWSQSHKLCEFSPQPTTQSPIDIQCSRDGYVPHPTDPHKYFQCEWIPGTGWFLNLRQCSTNTTWVQSHKKCESSIDSQCAKDGYVPHPTDPHRYYQCEWIPGTGWYLHLRQCSTNTTWVQSHKKCESSIDSQCAKDGYVPHPTDPHEYFQCEWIPGTGWYLHLMHCPAQTSWVQSHKRCDGQ